MKIEIGKFTVESDANQYTLTRNRRIEKGDNAGQTRTELLGYYSTLEGCLKAIPDKAVKLSDATSLREVVQILGDYKKLVESAVK